jgi:hypothetical protein
MDILDKLRKKNAANAVSDASLVKKLLHDLPLIRALGFLRKLRRLAKEKGKNDNLARDLIDAKENLEPKKKANLIKKLFKVYAYKVLSKLFDNLENIRKRNDGRWEARYISSYNNDGKAIYRSVYGHSYEEVKKKRDQIFDLKSVKTTKEITFAQC